MFTADAYESKPDSGRTIRRVHFRCCYLIHFVVAKEATTHGPALPFQRNPEALTCPKVQLVFWIYFTTQKLSCVLFNWSSLLFSPASSKFSSEKEVILHKVLDSSTSNGRQKYLNTYKIMNLKINICEINHFFLVLFLKNTSHDM